MLSTLSVLVCLYTGSDRVHSTVHACS